MEIELWDENLKKWIMIVYSIENSKESKSNNFDYSQGSGSIFDKNANQTPDYTFNGNWTPMKIWDPKSKTHTEVDQSKVHHA